MLGDTKVHCILDVSERPSGIMGGNDTGNVHAKLRRVLTCLSSASREQSL